MLDRSRSIVVDTVWRRRPPPRPAARDLAGAVELARRNDVAGLLASAYPARLRQETRRLERGSREFRRALTAASRALAAEGIAHTLIEAGPRENDINGTVDLVVRPPNWQAAIDALRPGAALIEMHPREREKLLLHPHTGVSVRLHRSVSWFDVPVLPAEVLEGRAEPARPGAWLVPDAADTLLISVACSAFQTLELSLADMLRMRPSIGTAVAERAAARAADGGWGESFERVLSIAEGLGDRLDAGCPELLPRPLPIATSYRVGAEHASAAWHASRRRLALHEFALRPALIAAQRRRELATRARDGLARARGLSRSQTTG